MGSVEGHHGPPGPATGHLDAASSPGLPEVHLALFGKHPAWRDFVAANPTADGHLSGTYEDLYCRCLDVLQSGAWGDDPAAVVPHFHHAFVRLWPGGDVVVGMLVGSADSLGRQQPMMLAACCHSVCYHQAIPSLMPALPALTRGVRLARQETEVSALLATAASDLAERVSATPRPGPGHASRVLRALLAQPELAEPGEALHRIVYQLIGHDAGTVVAPWGAPRGFADLLPAQIRIAIHSPEPAEAAEQWLTFVRYLCGREQPVTLFVSLGRTWGDLIVGAPTEAALAAILRLPEGELTVPAEGLEIPVAHTSAPEPLTHCVPFSLDDTFRSAVTRLRQEALNAPDEPIACLEAERSLGRDAKTAVDGIRGRVQSALGHLGMDRLPSGRPALAALCRDHRVRYVALAVAGIVLIALAALLFWWALRTVSACGPQRGIPRGYAHATPPGPALVAYLPCLSG